MAGPGSTEHSFNPEIFSTRRLVVAPTFCLAGYLLIAIGILYSQRSTKETTSETNKTYAIKKSKLGAACSKP